MENKMKFRIGQRAWSMRSGWGTIVDIGYLYQYPIYFKTDNNDLEQYAIDGKWAKQDLMPTLFHKEQIFDYSEPEIPIGTFGYFWEDSYNYRAVLGYYSGLTENGRHKCKGHLWFDNFCAYPELPPHFKENP